MKEIKGEEGICRGAPVFHRSEKAARSSEIGKFLSGSPSLDELREEERRSHTQCRGEGRDGRG